MVPGETGERFATRDVAALGDALARVRSRGGRTGLAGAVRQQVAGFGFERASLGLVAACQAVARRAAPRVVAGCGGMVVVGGLERMSFEVLRVVRQHGGSVHCIVNSWENHRIAPLAERIGASWSIGSYRRTLSRRSRNPIELAGMAWDILRTSGGLLRDAWRFRATHVFIPDHTAVIRNAPALALLRLFGVDIIFRMANGPERGSFYDTLWGRVLPRFVTTFVPISRFSRTRLTETGVPARKIHLIRNAVSRRLVDDRTDGDVVRLAARRRTILTVGQIAPFKGTHLAADAVLRLVANGYDVQGIVVGALPGWPADLAAYARHLVERTRAGGRVHFVGARENVHAIMQASYVLAAPILQEETFGNVLLEARHAGLPIVTFDLGALGELVEDRQTGLVCPATDLDALIDALRYLLDRPDERARMSVQSLAASVSADEDRTPVEFERRWWALFERAG